MNEKVLDFEAIERNLERYKNKKICAMVKANAYGHGLREVVLFLKDKIEFFGVCSFLEALEVKKICDAKVLIVSPFVDVKKCKEYGFHFFVEDLEKLTMAKELSCLELVHIKINSGMNRFGFNISDKKTLKKLRLILKNQHIAGICTHFSCLSDKKLTKKQYRDFAKVKKFLSIDALTHFGGSEALDYDFDYDMIRVGIGLYVQKNSQVMKIKSKIASIREIENGFVGYDFKFKVAKPTKVALVPIGYADGLSRLASGAYMRVLNKDAKIIGNVCMDICFLDVSNIDCKVGDEVEVLPNVFELAKKSHTSVYEVLTNFNGLRDR